MFSLSGIRPSCCFLQVSCRVTSVLWIMIAASVPPKLSLLASVLIVPALIPLPLGIVLPVSVLLLLFAVLPPVLALLLCPLFFLLCLSLFLQRPLLLLLLPYWICFGCFLPLGPRPSLLFSLISSVCSWLLLIWFLTLLPFFLFSPVRALFPR